MKKKITITESQLKMLIESRHRKKHGAYVEPQQNNDDDDEFYSREDEINYGAEEDEREVDEVNESIEKIKSEFKRFL